MGERRSYHHGDLRHALVAAASRMIAAEGVQRFSLREAAREVGVSANAAYRHFEDKSALLHAVAQEGFEELASAMVEARHDAGDARARLRAVGRTYIRFARDEPERFRLVFGPDGLGRVHWTPPEGASVSRVLGDTLDELVDARELTPAQREGAEVETWSLVHGFATLMLEQAGPWPMADDHDHVVERLLDFVLVGLTARVGSG